MTIESLMIAYGLIVIVLIISWHNQLTLDKEIAVASLRATVQLVIMGFLLEMILKLDNYVYLGLILLAMTAIAAAISGRRGRKIPHATGIAFTGILIGSVITFTVLASAGVIGPEAKYIIPMGGMIIGNSMNASSLSMNRLIGELGHQRKRIETLLALGANARQASEWAVRQSVRSALIPVIDSMKIIGLVHLPGIMTGFIIAGGSPQEAVKYQLAIMFMIAGTASLTCVIVTLLAARRCFTRELQLLDTFRPSTA